jgi:hypothetical protein
MLCRCGRWTGDDQMLGQPNLVLLIICIIWSVSGRSLPSTTAVAGKKKSCRGRGRNCRWKLVVLTAPLSPSPARVEPQIHKAQPLVNGSTLDQGANQGVPERARALSDATAAARSALDWRCASSNPGEESLLGCAHPANKASRACRHPPCLGAMVSSGKATKSLSLPHSRVRTGTSKGTRTGPAHLTWVPASRQVHVPLVPTLVLETVRNGTPGPFQAGGTHRVPSTTTTWSRPAMGATRIRGLPRREPLLPCAKRGNAGVRLVIL